MRPRSTKRAKQEKEYKRVCDEIDEELRGTRGWRCFFTNKPLPLEGTPSHHHLCGRIGSLLAEKKWIKPCFNWAHLAYHDLSVEKLERYPWYKGFLQRLKELDEGLYQKELNKKDKS